MVSDFYYSTFITQRKLSIDWYLNKRLLSTVSLFTEIKILTLALRPLFTKARENFCPFYLKELV